MDEDLYSREVHHAVQNIFLSSVDIFLLLILFIVCGSCIRENKRGERFEK